jgi:hypothetical protein
MALSKRLQKFLSDTAKSQSAARKRRQKFLDRIGPMTESETETYSSPSRNVPKQAKKSFEKMSVVSPRPRVAKSKRKGGPFGL